MSKALNDIVKSKTIDIDVVRDDGVNGALIFFKLEKLRALVASLCFAPSSRNASSVPRNGWTRRRRSTGSTTVVDNTLNMPI